MRLAARKHPGMPGSTKISPDCGVLFARGHRAGRDFLMATRIALFGRNKLTKLMKEICAKQIDENPEPDYTFVR
jgi:hypothetical protein